MDYFIYSYNCKEYTNIYSLYKKEKIKVIEKTNEYNTYYSLLWFNKKNKNNYIIELSDGNIYFYDIFDNDYFNIINLGIFNYTKIISGFIYTKNNLDYMASCSANGNIYITDLNNHSIINYLSLSHKGISKIKNIIFLSYILQWSNKYIIVCEYYNKGIKIIDIDKLKIISSIKEKNVGQIISSKKFIHPIYGESLLIASQDNNISLWTI